MKYKLIISDYDDTLTERTYPVSERTIKVIKQFQDNGGKFVICTTRPYGCIGKIAKNIGLDGEIICSQGATVMNLKNETVVKDNVLTSEEIKKILKFFKFKSYNIFLGCDNQFNFVNANIFAKIWNNKMDLNFKKAKSYDVILKTQKVNQILIGRFSRKKTQRLCEEARKHFGDKYKIGLCAEHLLNITKKGVSKGDAIKIIADKYGIQKNEIIAFGDSPNDAPMFDFSGVGVAMGNANEKLKAVATCVCDDVSNDGLAKFVEENVLNG